MTTTRLIPPSSQSTTRHPSRGHRYSLSPRPDPVAESLISLFEYRIISVGHERCLLLCSIEIIMPNGWWSMPAEPVPADPGRDEDLAWLDRDPERDCWPGRAREHDEPPLDEEYEDHEPLTGEELAEIGEADRKSTRLNSSHPSISYAVFCLEKKT